MLQVLLNEVATFFIQKNQPYLAALYAAIFTSMYYGMLRVGELAAGNHPILAVNVHIAQNKQKLLFILETSKTHDKLSAPQMVKIAASGNVTGAQIIAEGLTVSCPYESIRRYIKCRERILTPNKPFFIFRHRTPIAPYHIRQTLKIMLS